MHLIGGLDRALAKVSYAASVVGAGLIGLVGVVVVSDVVGRGLFSAPLAGTPEIARLSLVAIVFLTVPYAMRRRSHVRSTVIISRVPSPVAKALEVFAYSLAVVVFALVAWAAWGPMLQAWIGGEWEAEGVLKLPAAPVRTVIVVGAILATLESLSAAAMAARRIGHPSDDLIAPTTGGPV